MHTIKLLLTYYLNINVQAANLLDCRIESKKKIDSVARIESKLFWPELECSSYWLSGPSILICMYNIDNSYCNSASAPISK